MRALVTDLFPGARITSTTGGKHVAGSDHPKGQAIDFVPAGGMGQYSTAEVEKILEDAGVTIRRNANGTKQIFGPGRSAVKPGDHDDHFHVAWTGGASPEEAERRAAQAKAKRLADQEKEDRRVEAIQPRPGRACSISSGYPGTPDRHGRAALPSSKARAWRSLRPSRSAGSRATASMPRPRRRRFSWR